MIQISAIICTYNRANYLNKALESLKRQSLNKSYFEVIVVDNGSTDDIKQIVENFYDYLKIKYVLEERLGLSRARNRGIEEAKGKYVAFMDDDCEADWRWLEEIVNSFKKSAQPIQAVGGKILLKYKSSKPAWMSKNMESFLGFFFPAEKPCFLKYLRGGNMAFCRESLQQLNGFNYDLGRQGRSLLSSEEYELFERFFRFGFKIYYNPKIITYHNVLPERLHKFWFYKRYFWQGVSDETVRFVNYNARRLFLVKSLIKEWSLLIIKSWFFIKFFFPCFSSSNCAENKCRLFWRLGKIFKLLYLIKK